MRVLIKLFAILWAASYAMGQAGNDDTALRKQAFDLMQQNQVVQAASILEGLAQRHPGDVAVQERLGMARLGVAATLNDKEQARSMRVQARAALLRAKELGDNSDLLNSVLPNLSEDGTVASFSKTQEVEAEMREGESQFARGDLAAAITHYGKALFLDPKQYYAALFAGDASFKLKDYAAAATWFDRAIAIDPDIETAHRYFADSLLAEHKFAEGRAQFIEAIVADPYNRRVWLGLNNLNGHVTGAVQRLHFPPQATVTTKGKNTNINLDPSATQEKNSWGAFWMAYGVARAAWKKDHTNPADSRSTSLAEESAAYDNAIRVVDAKDSITLTAHPELNRLKQVQAAGLVDAWVLIDQPDQEIAQDYQPYRAKNRDKIRRYLDDFVVPKIE